MIKNLSFVLFLVLFSSFLKAGVGKKGELKIPSKAEEETISRFQTYLRIDTRQPKPDYKAAHEFLISQMKEIGLSYRLITPDNSTGKSMFLGIWEGKETTAKSVLFTSHMDVVPISAPKEWKYDPMGAHIDENGDIYCRGSQDMKSIGLGYLEGIRLLKKEGFVPTRTIYVLFTVDEEIGSSAGMGAFSKTKEFKDLNVGFVLDEGVPNPEKGEFGLYYGERAPNWVKFIATGKGGHGSQFVPNTAASKIIKLTSKIQEFREHQELSMKLRGLDLGNVISVNVDAINLGVSSDCGKTFSVNVIPKIAEAYIDLRSPPNVGVEKITELLDSWSKEFDVTYEIIQQEKFNPISDISEQNHFYKELKASLVGNGYKVNEKFHAVSTDSRFWRQNGINAFGFSGFDDTQFRLHAPNEYLNKDIYLKSILLYKEIISRVANVK